MKAARIDHLNIDKSKWTLVKFGDVVKEPKESTKTPLEEGLEHLVGLEHINKEDIHLRRSASLANTPTTFTKKFAVGDVLFGRRRAYLKKAAQATFAGICSGDITVFRTKGDLIPELLPFVVQNEKFFDYAIKHSAGGLSPRVKFKDLANYEFLLPPKEQQGQLAELLWGMDEVVEREMNLSNRYKIFYKRYLYDSTGGKISKKINTWNEYLLGELGVSFGGLTGKSKKDFGSGSPYINYMNVFTNSRVDTNQVDYVKVYDGENQHKVKYGDILITGSSETPQELGMSSIVLDNLEGYYLNSFCFGFRLHNFNLLLPEYARFLMRGEDVRKFMFKYAQGSTRFNLSKTTVKEKLKITLPSLPEQLSISTTLSSLYDNIGKIKLQIQSSKSLQKSLINQIF